VRPYIALLRRPGVARILAGQTIGRLTPGMILLAVILAMRQGGYGYAVVGLVTGAHQLGVAVSSPWQGRAADVLGHRTVLVPDGILYLAGTAALTLGIGRTWTAGPLIATALMTGLASPPMTACARAALGAMFGTGREREQAFVLTSASVESGFIIGPLATAALAATVGPGWAVVGAGASVLVGALVYASGPRIAATGARPVTIGAPRWRATSGGAWRSPGLRVMVVVYLSISATFGAFDLFTASVAEAAGRPNLVGSLIAIIAGASLIGGFVYGSRIWAGTLRGRMRDLTALLAVMLLLLPLLASDLRLLAAAMFLVGSVVGPMNVVGFQLIDDVAPSHARAEAQSWVQASVYLGSSLGAPLTGLVIERFGPRPAMLVGVLGVCVATVTLTRSRTLAGCRPTGREPVTPG
jgi:MFS family permease